MPEIYLFFNKKDMLIFMLLLVFLLSLNRVIYIISVMVQFKIHDINILYVIMHSERKTLNSSDTD